MVSKSRPTLLSSCVMSVDLCSSSFCNSATNFQTSDDGVLPGTDTTGDTLAFAKVCFDHDFPRQTASIAPSSPSEDASPVKDASAKTNESAPTTTVVISQKQPENPAEEPSEKK